MGRAEQFHDLADDDGGINDHLFPYPGYRYFAVVSGELNFGFGERIDIHCLIGDFVVVQDSLDFAAEGAYFVLIEGDPQAFQRVRAAAAAR